LSFGGAHGVEWIVEARGCNPLSLKSIGKLQTLFSRLVHSMNLHPVGDAMWHQFPGAGGITGLYLLAESHLACHTFPEFGSLCLNIFCCRPHPSCDLETLLGEIFDSNQVEIREFKRYLTAPVAPSSPVFAGAEKGDA
jgi:S-adenosylmethionine decarboxylase